MKNQTKYFQTKHMIKKCFNLNFSIPKGYGTRSATYRYWYDKKAVLIRKIVKNIKIYHLNIKYGVVGGVIYFSFEGEQYSFHGYYGVKKRYNGQWIGTPRTKYNKARNGQIIGADILYY